MDDRLGVRASEQHGITPPQLSGLGGPLPSGTAQTVVPVGAQHYYVLPPGVGISPDHDELVHLALIEEMDEQPAAPLEPEAPAEG